MFTLVRPKDEAIARRALSLTSSPLSYGEVGATREGTSLPPWANHDFNRVRVGQGRTAYEKACAALRSWSQFSTSFTRAVPSTTPIEEGRVVGVAIKTLGLWTVNYARIVYTIAEERRFGFAYGTTRAHVERGEERFLVSWDPETDTVWFDILAFSQPRHWLVALGKPYARVLQRRFVRESLAGMGAR